MARVPPLERDQAPPAVQAEYDAQRAAHGRVTNMKRTLGHSLPALRALMQWYPLRDAAAEFLGERLTTLFAFAVSSQTDCLICSTFFRRHLIEAGEDPTALRLDEREQAVVDYGRQLARDANAVDDALYLRVSRYLSGPELVTLTAFGGLMIATNLFNNALQVDLDGYLEPYRKEAPRAGS